MFKAPENLPSNLKYFSITFNNYNISNLQSTRILLFWNLDLKKLDLSYYTLHCITDLQCNVKSLLNVSPADYTFWLFIVVRCLIDL